MDRRCLTPTRQLPRPMLLIRTRIVTALRHIAEILKTAFGLGNPVCSFGGLLIAAAWLASAVDCHEDNHSSLPTTRWIQDSLPESMRTKRMSYGYCRPTVHGMHADRFFVRGV